MNWYTRYITQLEQIYKEAEDRISLFPSRLIISDLLMQTSSIP